FSGIGNWMADEILWRARILPSKRTGKLSESERAAIFQATKFVVRKSLQTLGKDFSDPPRNWLIHQKWKHDGTCPRHRTPLRHATIATERHAFHFDGTRKFTKKKTRFVIGHIDAGTRWDNEVRAPTLGFIKSLCVRRCDLDSREPFHVLFSEIAGHDDSRGITV